MAADRAYRLKKGEDPAAGLGRIAAGRAEKAIEELRGTGEESDRAEAIHSARKDLKKLRSVLRLVRTELGGERFRAENDRYRGAARRLSASRDAEIKLATLTALARRFDGQLPGDSLTEWQEALSSGRTAAATDEALLGEIERAIGEIEAGREEIGRWRLPGGSWKLLDPGLERTYRRGRRAKQQAGALRNAEAVHEWRKRVKDLWYQLRIVQEAWPPILGAMADQAHGLAELLGEHHDLALLLTDLEGRRQLPRKEALAAAIDERQGELLDDALSLGACIYAEKPKAFRCRLSAYWE